VQGFLGPGHVCAIMGFREYEALAARYKVPIVVSGFEPVDLLQGILYAVRQLEAGRAEVENQYARTVSRDGNAPARALLREVFDVVDRKWRGVGAIPKSGFRIRHEYRAYDAERKFAVDDIVTRESSLCISGLILRGLKKPSQCSAFGCQCTPETPLGATMVSSEGACAAYYQYGRRGVA
jgi:hydrogenase expression/formation protein HypD